MIYWMTDVLLILIYLLDIDMMWATRVLDPPTLLINVPFNFKRLDGFVLSLSLF
jgi:hypothetical protein